MGAGWGLTLAYTVCRSYVVSLIWHLTPAIIERWKRASIPRKVYSCVGSLNMVTLDIVKKCEETNIFLIKLSDQNKTSLLRKEWKVVLTNSKKAKNIIQRLQNLNSVIAVIVELKDAAIFQFIFRLLCSSKSNHDVSFYLVINYCWRHMNWNSVIQNTATLWNICRSMIEKILKLRSSSNEEVWVNASCINQKDDEEKDLVIESMNVLYRVARLLIIVLEDVQLVENEQIVVMKYFDMC